MIGNVLAAVVVVTWLVILFWLGGSMGRIRIVYRKQEKP